LTAAAAIVSTLATGTAPLTVASTTKVDNLNADQWDGKDLPSYSGGESITIPATPYNLIIKMGVSAQSQSWGVRTVTFAEAFPNGIVVVVACGILGTATDRNDATVVTQSKTGFTSYGYDDIRWIAIGY